jgi:hypothetical protein
MAAITLQDIPRVKAGSAVATTNTKNLSEIDQERLYLATRAKDVLGYDLLKQSVTGVRRVGTCEGKLTETLLRLDITILDTATVIKYQMEEIVRRNEEYIITHLKDWAGPGWGITLASWQKSDLADYQMPVPEFVLDKAIKIKEQLPEVKFNIHHLNDPKADPFLVAYLGNEVYFVDAWDEPRFEAGI